MTDLLVLATSSGVVLTQKEAGGWRVIDSQSPPPDPSSAMRPVTSLAIAAGTILAGTRQGVFRSDDRGATWRGSSSGLTIPYVRWLYSHPKSPGRVFAGTEPAGIFISGDAGQTWRGCPEVEAMRREHGWSLPYSPEAGCVRGFAFHGRRGYAAVEDGCVLISDDVGDTWRLAAGSRGRPDHLPQAAHIHSDVHSIEVHPHNPEWVAAPTGGGFFISFDGGQSWENRYPRCYSRAVWWDPSDPDHLILGPADGVDRLGRIEESYDRGRTWQNASAGSKAPWPAHMVERFAQLDGHLFAVLSDGSLLTKPLAGLEWETILPQIGHVNAVASL